MRIVVLAFALLVACTCPPPEAPAPAPTPPAEPPPKEPPPAEPPAQALPAQAEKCDPAQGCASGLTCVSYFGIAGPSALPAALVGRTRVYSDSRLVRRLNYHPAYDLLEAIHETVVWHRRVTRYATSPAVGQPSVIRVLS